MFETITERKRRKIFHPLAHFPNGNWVDQKPETRNFFPVSQVGSGPQGFEPPSTSFPGHKHGVGLEVQKPERESAPMWDSSAVHSALLIMQ